MLISITVMMVMRQYLLHQCCTVLLLFLLQTQGFYEVVVEAGLQYYLLVANHLIDYSQIGDFGALLSYHLLFSVFWGVDIQIQSLLHGYHYR